jgi:hypothetical protein
MGLAHRAGCSARNFSGMRTQGSLAAFLVGSTDADAHLAAVATALNNLGHLSSDAPSIPRGETRPASRSDRIESDWSTHSRRLDAA